MSEDIPIVVVDKLLDGPWAARAHEILAVGEKEGRFNTSCVLVGRDRALFAFQHEETEASDAIGVLTYVTFTENEYHRIFRIALLSVLPSHRRAGIGTALIDRAYALAIDEKCTEIDALVSSFNFPMMRMLQRTSFDSEVVCMRKRIEENRRADEWDF